MLISRRGVMPLIAGVVAGPARLHAQDFPQRPIRLVVGSAPGGVHDVAARLWADGVKNTLGTIVVDNRGGAGGMIGMQEAARSAPDGHTLLLGSNSNNILGPLFSRPGIDPIKAFEPVTIFSLTSTGIAVAPSLKVGSLQELIQLAKNNPGKLSYAHANVGAISHVAAEMFKQLAGGLDILPVPYKGMGPAQIDVVNGTVSMFLPNITGQVVGLHSSGQMKLLCINAAARHPSLPDVPTSAEAGLPGMVTLNFFGVFAPVGTPRAAIEKLDQMTQKALTGKELQNRLAGAAMDAVLGFGPEKSRVFVAEEASRWRKVVQGAGIKTP